MFVNYLEKIMNNLSKIKDDNKFSLFTYYLFA